MSKIVKVGIMPLADYKKRTMAIVKGDYKPTRHEPKVWFQSMKAFANVLSEDNQYLLKLIVEKQPKSVTELASLTKRHANNVLRTLRTMEQYGFVKLLKSKSATNAPGRNPLMPKVIFDKIELEIVLSSAP